MAPDGMAYQGFWPKRIMSRHTHFVSFTDCLKTSSQNNNSFTAIVLIISNLDRSIKMSSDGRFYANQKTKVDFARCILTSIFAAYTSDTSHGSLRTGDSYLYYTTSDSVY